VYNYPPIIWASVVYGKRKEVNYKNIITGCHIFVFFTDNVVIINKLSNLSDQISRLLCAWQNCSDVLCMNLLWRAWSHINAKRKIMKLKFGMNCSIFQKRVTNRAINSCLGIPMTYCGVRKQLSTSEVDWALRALETSIRYILCCTERTKHFVRLLAYL
jgi:hypothetical protein